MFFLKQQKMKQIFFVCLHLKKNEFYETPMSKN